MVFIYIPNKVQMQIYCDYCFYGITFEERIKCSCYYDICINCIINLKSERNFKLEHALHNFYFIKKCYYENFKDKIFLESLFFSGILNLQDISILMNCSEEDIEKKFTSQFKLTNVVISNFQNQKSSFAKHKYLSNYFPKRGEIDFDLYDYSLFFPVRNDLSAVNVDILFEIYRSHNRYLKFFEQAFIKKNLVNFTAIERKLKKLSKNKQKIFDQYKVFYQFMSRKDFNIFIYGLFKEEEIRKKLTTKKFTLNYEKLLNPTEILFCKKINISQSFYQKLKSYCFLMMNYEKNVSRDKIMHFFKGNIKQANHLIHFFKLNKWIK